MKQKIHLGVQDVQREVPYDGDRYRLRTKWPQGKQESKMQEDMKENGILVKLEERRYNPQCLKVKQYKTFY